MSAKRWTFYVRTLADCCKHCPTTVQLFHRPVNIQFRRGFDKATPCRQSFYRLGVGDEITGNEKGDGRFDKHGERCERRSKQEAKSSLRRLQAS
ncbi:unnamed protein product [Strongylus vulgaris]|uniref:Uncharacterized protein n=1 Tax=Strongylus vulgaris TaxID=40348 RepID=A0A3P7IY13_STRVU|nr:unnamed protein product [Strongylus vulgaris]